MTAILPATIPSNSRTHSPFTSGISIVLALALVRLIVYGIAGQSYGYFRDELYYLACGEHPAWGYVDQPPLIAWIACLLQHSVGTSLWALRLLPALAGAATVVLTGLLARELGGRRWAMFLASLTALLAPILLVNANLFTMNAFDPFLWTASAFLVIRIAKFSNQYLWVPIGLLTGFGVLNKYSILFWLSGLLLGVMLTPLRASLRQHWFWLGCALAAVIALPNFLWQWHHHFPFVELMHNVRASGRDIVLPPIAYLKAQAEMLGYAAALLIPFALLFAFSRTGRPCRALALAFVVFLAEMMALHGKSYYVAPVYPTLFAGGAVWVDSFTRRKSLVWVKPLFALLIATVSCIYAPTLLPILSVPNFLAYEHKMGIQQAKSEHSTQGVLPQLYADMFGWESLTERVAAYYNSLSPEERSRTAIFGNNYGEAAAIDFFGPRYGLPRAIGGHQNYWIWGPRNYTGESLIVLGEGHESNMQTKCASYSIIDNPHDPLSRPDEWLPIYHCRGLRLNLQTDWPKLKRWR